MVKAASPSVLVLLVLAGWLLAVPAAAQTAASDGAAPAPEAAAPASAPEAANAPPEQPTAAFNASSTTQKTTVKTLKKKKRAKKRSHDFTKKHAARRGKVPEVDLNAVPGAANAAAPAEKRGYDPSISEPTEEVMAIKNNAEKKFWNGKKPLNADVNAPGGIAAQPLSAPNPNNLERASASDLAGVTFDDQPLRMPESDAFKRSIDTVGFELGRPCRSHEYFGWPLQQTEQDRVNRIFEETITKFRLRGFSIAPHQPRAAAGDISVFTADRSDGRFNKNILGLWSAGDVGLLLLVCDTEAPSDLIAAQKHKAEAVRAKKKKLRKKRTAKKVETPAEKPQVIPGAAAESVTPPPAPKETPKDVLVPVPPVSPSAASAPPVPPPPPPSAAVMPAPPAAAAQPAPPPPQPSPPVAPAQSPPPSSPATPAPAQPSDVPPPAQTSTAPPPPPAPTTPPSSAPASPSATQGKEAPSPVEPAKPPEPAASTGVQTIPYGGSSASSAPAAPGNSPSGTAANKQGSTSALTPPSDRDKAGTAPPADSSRNFSGSAPPPAQ